MAEGGGWLEEVAAPKHSRRFVWCIAGPGFPNPDYGGAITWSRQERFRVDASAVARRVSRSPGYISSTSRPMAAQVFFDFGKRRFTLVGGPALVFYRRLQDRVAAYLFV